MADRDRKRVRNIRRLRWCPQPQKPRNHVLHLRLIGFAVSYHR